MNYQIYIKNYLKQISMLSPIMMILKGDNEMIMNIGKQMNIRKQGILIYYNVCLISYIFGKITLKVT
jgi:hypothetical protein